MASTYIKRTCDGAYTSTFTWSAWVKRSATGSYHGLFCNKKNDSNSNSRVRFYFSDADRLAMEVKDSTSGDDSFFQTNKLFRDVNAWYHIVLAYDTTQGAENDRIKLWINNEEITSWEQFNRAGSGFGTLWSSAMEHRIGTQNSNAGTNYYFNGSMSHVHLTYGTAYDATAFGQYDANGVWTIKTSPSVTYGSQGYFVLKDGNSLTDQSGEGNNFTVGGGTLTKTEDNPSNVFATLNPLDNKFATDAVFSNGNTYVAAGGAANGRFYSTLGMVSGKYYCEIKNVSGSGGTPLFAVTGTSNYALSGAGSPLSSQLYDYALYNGNVYNNDATVGGTWGTPSDGNIIGIAINLDNEQGGLNKLYFSINGVWQNGADPSNLTSTTGVVGIIKPENMTGNGVGAYFFACGDDNSYAERRFATNFGNGFFQTTAVSSAGTNASGIGIFEYDVPTGYTALSTKGLNL